MPCKTDKAIFHAVLAAALYAISIPTSKFLQKEVPPTMLAAFLYIGAGIGMVLLGALRKERNEAPLLFAIQGQITYLYTDKSGFICHI